jgi:hypothetical protein
VISFRYHLVSVIAIFLAIALGVVIGTSALNGAVVGDLRRQVSDLKNSNSATTSQNQALQARSGDADEIAKAFGAKIASGALTGKSVVLVGAPGVSSDLKSAIAAQVVAAGGKVSGRIQLTTDFTDPKRGNDIRSLATSGAHPIGLQLPPTDDAGTLAGALLGFVLLGHGQATDLTQVLAGFGTLNMMKIDAGSVAPGQVVLLVAPGAMGKNDPTAAMLYSTATQMGVSGGPTVVVGDTASATSGGVLAVLRASDTARKAVSTVDDATGALGQLTVVLTAAQAIAGHKGQFGTSVGADGLIPESGQ